MAMLAQTIERVAPHFNLFLTLFFIGRSSKKNGTCSLRSPSHSVSRDGVLRMIGSNEFVCSF